MGLARPQQTNARPAAARPAYLSPRMRRLRLVLITANFATPPLVITLAILGHWWAALAVLAFGHGPITWAVFNPSCTWLGPVITRFDADQPEVWLTIDDGPDPEDTPRLLEILAARGAKATFFVVGEKAERHPELCRRILAEGHRLANHTWSHPAAWQWLFPRAMLRREIDRCAQVLADLGAGDDLPFRATAGHKNPFLHGCLSGPPLAWSARGFDACHRDLAGVLGRITPDLRPGAIVLMHESGRPGPDGARFAPALLGALLDELERRGLRTCLPERERWR